MPAPKKGSTFTATVRDLASDGRGILSHPDGLTVFVAGVWPGEECRIRFIGLQNRLGLGEVLEVITPSPHRVQAECPHHGFEPGKCGGCPWQFMDYTEQLAFKQARVNQTFERFGAEVNNIWPSEHIYTYRNRAQLKTDGKIIGYVSANSNELAPIQTCPILTEQNQQTLQALLRQLPNDAWRIRARPQHKKQKLRWTSLNIDDSVSVDNVVVNKRLPFQQSHHQQNARMREWLANHISALTPIGSVLELFCGSGNFTEVIAANADAAVVAVEGDKQALLQLEESLVKEKQQTNIKTIAVDLFNPDNYSLIARSARDYSILVLDPPRDGIKTLDALLLKLPKLQSIFYISCNLATLSRDLQSICARGFAIREVQPLDQTPHTPHIELLVYLQK